MGRRTDGAHEFQELIKRFPEQRSGRPGLHAADQHGPEVPVRRGRGALQGRRAPTKK